MGRRFRSVEARLVVWSVLVTALFITCFSAATFLLLQRNVERRTDESLAGTCRALAASVAREAALPHERDSELEALVRDEAAEFIFRDREVAVFTPDGRLVGSSRGNAATPLTAMDVGLLRRIALSAARGPRFTSLEVHDASYRLYALPFSLRGTPFVVVTARHLGEQEELLENVVEVFWYAAPLWIALSGVAGWLLVRKSLAPVAAMSREAVAIRMTDLTRRLPVADPDNELGFLATTFNALLDRLAQAIEQQRRFMADASHELRTPLSIVRGEAEVALTRERSTAELRDALQVIQHESELLTSIVDDLFLLARADAGQRLLAPTRFYLDELLHDAVRAVRTLADEKGIVLEVRGPHDAAVEADERLLRRLFGNLLDNAVKFTPRGGSVSVTLADEAAAYAVTIRDSGPGIPPTDRPRIFERFYRGTKREGEGAGLGLAIARSIAEMHGGTLVLGEGDAGSVFRAVLPKS
jgi:two-component system OmpR family sensor kinase